MAPMSAEATVSRNYLDVLLGLPWGKKSKVKQDIARRRRSSTRTITAWRR
jgi:ATP-dependent Lon protease